MPLQIKDIIDLQTLVESEQVEFKLAGGKDGKGELPKDFWPTYSAMANGRGGWVVRCKRTGWKIYTSWYC